MAFNTASILKFLQKSLHGDFPAPVLAGAAVLDAPPAQIRDKITNSEQDNVILSLITAIDKNLEELEKSKSTLPLREDFLKRVVPLKVSAIEGHDRREELIKQLLNYIRELQAATKEVITELKKGRTQPASFLSHPKVEPLVKERAKFEKDYDVIQTAGNIMAMRLSEVNGQIAGSIASILGVKPASPTLRPD